MSKKMIALFLCASILLPLFLQASPVARAEETTALTETAASADETTTVPSEAATSPTLAAAEAAPDYSQNVGKYATFNVAEIGFFDFTADPESEGEGIVYAAEEFPADLTVVITDWFVDSLDGIWYKIEAAPGDTLPEDIAQNPWVLDGYVGDELVSLLKFDAPAEEEFPAQELTKTTEQGIQVGVTGAMPEGTQLSVQDVTVDAAQYGIADASTILAALDIRLLASDGTDYQPYTDEKEVIVTIDAEKLGLVDGDVVRLHHNHEGTITVYDPYVVIDGKLTFWTDRFSIYVVNEPVMDRTGDKINPGGTYEMKVGETKIFWADYGGPAQCLWQVLDNSNAIDYFITALASNGGWRPWITVEARDVGVVQLTCVVQGGTGGEPWPFTLNIVAPEAGGLYIDDNAAENGCLVPAWSEDSTVDLSRVRYTWSRSDGQTVRPQAMNSDGSINISIDRGGATSNANGTANTITYTVTATDLDGANLGNASYEVLYGNEILNPSFEQPGGFDRGHTTFYNGYPGLYWKTTAPGTGGHLGKDIEMGHSIGNPYGIKAAADGSYFVELNAEEFGALYQDMLTTPGASLTWSFSHAKRSDSKGEYDRMYVIVAATQYAQEIITKNDIDELLDAAIAQSNNGADIPDNDSEAYSEGFEFTFTKESTGQTGTYRIWHSKVRYYYNQNQQWKTISGTYKVPDGQYLTRLFFASDTNDPNSANSTLGNMIDAAYAGEFMSYIVEYYKADNLQSSDTETAENISAYTTVQLSNLQKYLDVYKYPYEILINGRPYPGTIANLQKGLLLMDYGSKTGEIENNTKYEPYNLVLQIVFQDPNIRVTKIVEIEGWDDWTPEEKKKLLDAGIKAEFKLTNRADSSDTHTTGVSITQEDTDGKLTSAASFRTISEDDFGKVFNVSETSATSILNYALQTTITPESIGVKQEAGERVKNVTVTNRYIRNVGNLTIKKDVVNLDGYTAPVSDEFVFIVSGPAVTRGSYMVSINNAADTEYPVTGGKLTIRLKAGEWAVIRNLDLEEYKVEEVPNEHYILTSVTGNTGTIVKENIAYAGFTNTYSPNGDLQIEKFVDLGINQHIPIDENQEFTFYLELKNVPSTLDGPYSYTIKNYVDNSMVKSGTMVLSADNKLSFSLKHNQYILIQDLPATEYTLSEADYTKNGYLAPYYYIGSTGPETVVTSTIPKGATEIVKCNNPVVVSNGDLKITKQVETSDPDANVPPKAFEFTVWLRNAPDIDGASYDVKYTCDSTKGTLSADQKTYKLGDQTFELAQTVTAVWDLGDYYIKLNLYDGLSATILNLPPCGYQVSEANYTADKFGTRWEGNTVGYIGGVKVGGENPVTSLTCINTYNVTTGKLEITKNVKKGYIRDMPPEVAFEFTITPAEGITLTGEYKVTIGKKAEQENTDGTILVESTTQDVVAADNKLVVRIPFTEEEQSKLQLNEVCTKILTVQGLPFGSYTVAEGVNPDYVQSKSPLMAEISGTVANVTFTNTYRQHVGQITIKKYVSGTDASEPVLVKIEEGNNLLMTVPVIPEQPVTIYDLPLDKTYKVSEITSWNWRYSAAGSTSQEVTLTMSAPNSEVTFNNTYTKDKWLTDTDIVQNIFSIITNN